MILFKLDNYPISSFDSNSLTKGCFIILLPVAVFIALATVAPAGGKLGSPKPVGAIVFLIKWVTTFGDLNFNKSI